jgi:hypothetical protein
MANMSAAFVSCSFFASAALLARTDGAEEPAGSADKRASEAACLDASIPRLLDEVSYDATRLSGQTVVVDAGYVNARLQSLSQDEDLSRYIL